MLLKLILERDRYCSITSEKHNRMICNWRILEARSDKGNVLRTDFVVWDDGLLLFGTRLCVPSDQTLRGEILDEAHSSAHVMHPGSTKIYRDLREHYR